MSRMDWMQRYMTGFCARHVRTRYNRSICDKLGFLCRDSEYICWDSVRVQKQQEEVSGRYLFFLDFCYSKPSGSQRFSL